MVDSSDSELTEKISEAIATGEVILILYDRGSHPGTARQISPISLNGNKLRAFCLSSGKSKVFLTEAIRLPANENQCLDYDSSPGMSPIDLLSLKKELFESAGWSVQIQEDRLSLHGYRKGSSQPLKRPTISIVRSHGEARYPWVVSGPSKGSAFKKPEKAIDLFMSEFSSTPPPTRN